MPLGHTGFQSLLNRKFYDGSDLNVADVARKIGLASSTLYKYIEGILTFPPDLIAPLYNATGDIDFLIFIIQDTDKRLVGREGKAGVKPVIAKHLDVAAAAGELANKVRLCLEDGDIDEVAKVRLIKIANQLHLEVEEFVECVNKA